MWSLIVKLRVNHVELSPNVAPKSSVDFLEFAKFHDNPKIATNYELFRVNPNKIRVSKKPRSV